MDFQPVFDVAKVAKTFAAQSFNGQPQEAMEKTDFESRKAQTPFE
jgi:hypothetical protein